MQKHIAKRKLSNIDKEKWERERETHCQRKITARNVK